MKYWRTILCALALAMAGLVVWAADSWNNGSAKGWASQHAVVESASSGGLAAVPQSMPPSEDLAREVELAVAKFEETAQPSTKASARYEVPGEPPPASKPDLADPPLVKPSPVTPGSEAWVGLVPIASNASAKLALIPPGSEAPPPPLPSTIPSTNSPASEPIPPFVKGPPPLPESPRPSTPAQLPTPPSFDPPPPPPTTPPLPEPPKPPTVAKNTMRPLKLHVHTDGSGRPSFEIRDGDQLLLSVTADKLEISAAHEGKTPLPDLSAHGDVRLHGFGLDGTCNHLRIVPAIGEVWMNGDVRLPCNRGGPAFEVMAEQLRFQLIRSDAAVKPR